LAFYFSDRSGCRLDRQQLHRKWLEGWFLDIAGFLFFCAFGMVISSMAKYTPWLHIRVTRRSKECPRQIRLSFPLPLRFAGKVMDHFSWAMPEKLQE